jgi:hypothetical protein
MSETDDPLEGADIGETVAVENQSELWLGELADHDQTAGSDRYATHELADAEIRTDEYGDKHLVVTVESEVTKKLPRRWDDCREPRTDEEAQQARRRRWIGGILKHGSTVAIFGIAAAIATKVTNEAMSNLVIDGSQAPTLGWEFVVTMMAFVGMVILALKYAPGMAGKRGRVA